MTQYVLANAVRLLGRKYLPGTIIDNVDDPIAELQSVGALLWPLSDAVLAAAQDDTRKARLQGGNEEVLQELIQAGINRRFLGTLQPDAMANPALSQSEWFIDALNGNDANDGSVSAPIRTKRSLAWRLGGGAPQQPTKVYLLTDEEPGDVCSLHCQTDQNTLTFYGTKTLVTQGTVTAVAAVSVPAPGSSGGSLATVTDGSKPANFWAAFAGPGFIVENVTAGTWFHVNADLGGATASITIPMTGFDPAFPNDAFSVLSIPVAIGDVYKVWKLPKHTFARLHTGNDLGLGLRNIDVQQVLPQTTPYSTISVADVMMSESTIRASIIPQAVLATQFLNNCRVSSIFAVLGSGIVLGGLVESFTLASIGTSTILDFDVILKSLFAKAPFTGQFQLGAVYLDGNIDSRAFEGGVFTPSGNASLTVQPFLTAARVWGPGTVRIHHGDHFRYAGTAQFSLRTAGGISLDNGATAFTVDAGGVTSFRAVTPANIDAAIGAGGFSGSCQTVNGTRVMPGG